MCGEKSSYPTPFTYFQVKNPWDKIKVIWPKDHFYIMATSLLRPRFFRPILCFCL